MDGHKHGYILLIVAAVLSYVATLVFNVLATGYGASIGRYVLFMRSNVTTNKNKKYTIHYSLYIVVL